MDFAAALALGELVYKIGMPAYKAYCETNKDNADAFTKEAIQAVIDSHETTEETLERLGVDSEEFIDLDSNDQLG